MSKQPTLLPCIFLLSCIFFYLVTIQVHCTNNETDYRALVAFKDAISDPQGNLNSWNRTVHLCSWPGIYCSRRHRYRVAAIDLTSQGLIGPLSPHLGNLSFLKIIILQNNSFHGQIPDEIGRLRRIQVIEFSNNSFSGQIPRNLSQCTNIYDLNLVDNNLTGIIPLELSSLVKLESIALGINQLTGTIPPFIGNFTSLIQLYLTECGIQGNIPESLVQLKSLLYLGLNGNNLTGNVPPGLFNISTMLEFFLSSNRLEGTIPSEIGSTFSSLQLLSLWGNHFTGEIPISLSNISSLQLLLLQLNNFKGSVEIDFSRLTALSKLHLGDNNLDGDLNFISSMINCTQLLEFGIYSNQLSGSLPHSIFNLTRQLYLLSINGNQLYGTIPPDIGDLRGLALLDLHNNNFHGPIPSEINKLNELQVLHLSGNKFTSEIPLSFGNMTLLTELSLDQNNFSGNIPQSLGHCIHLQELWMSYNNISGPIPRQIMSLGLVILDFSHNALTGPIPDEVGSLINLENLDLSSNRLSGSVPKSFGSCVRLENLSLQNNYFDGEIPDDFRSLKSLQYMDLSHNNLSGTIPTFFGELDLLYLNLSFNRLEGRVPGQGVFLNGSALSLEGNKDLCGGIPSLNFTPCSFKNSRKHKHFSLVLKVLIPVVSVGAISLACYCIFICRQRKSKDTHASSMVSLEAGYLRLSYADLLKSTDGFSELNLLGAGRFGSVYKGILHDVQTPVAVKVLHLNVKGASKNFISECNVLRSIRHRNLVIILNVCSSIDFQGNDFKALVYEFMTNGNLDEWLHHEAENGSKTLGLGQRLDIAIDIASAVEYLHVGTDSTIVHGDLKPSNVLLDEEMTARVGDFGLAKIVSNLFSTNASSTSVGIRGTIGYIAPEYGMSGVVSTQGDVYSYGILLLEMFTGRRPTDDGFDDSCSLHDLVKNALPKQVMEVLDPIIIQECNDKKNVVFMDCVISILKIGVACSMESARDRMTMSEVVNQLQKDSQILAKS